ncbi:MAG: sodium/proton-translocating pyrophosphatase, partial [Marinirhabdus sp.]
EMVEEVRRQFREIPGIMEGTGTPEYAKCVDISTKAALKEMILPGLLTLITPVVIGLLFGAEPLGGYMAGVCVSGVMWAIFQNNAGGAWDNAKKSFEAGVMINGKMSYKGSDAHKAAVTGDTVGDPFKDTSGPSMNILIKLTCLVGLVIAPLLGNHGDVAMAAENDYGEMYLLDADGNKTLFKKDETEKSTKAGAAEISKEVKVEMAVEGDVTTAKVTIETTQNGETTTSTRTFSGTEEEVRARVEAIKDVEVKVEGNKKVIKKVEIEEKE